MNLFRKIVTSLAVAAILVLPVRAGDRDDNDGRLVQHVLLISVDGLHALDLTNYVAAHPSSTLAQLSSHGITYTDNSTSSPSDSFPGLASLVTGGSPVTTGLWYDDTYNRKLSPPKQTDGLGNPGGSCPGTIGTNVAWDEAIDLDLTKLNGGGGINPNYLVRDPANGCAIILPHQYLRVNTIFEVVKANGGSTAWTDKHPSYEWTNGPSGRGVDDFYGPEINSIPVALPQFPGCSPVPFADPTPDDGWTTDIHNIQCYDDLHVQAVLNQIDGYTHDRAHKVQEIFALSSLAEKFDVPGSAAGDDPRTPDIVLKVSTGVIFTGGSKIAEHGGFNEDDVHTALLVSLPSIDGQTVKTTVSNQQVVPTILKALGMDPGQLQAVQKEHIHVLPFLFGEDDR